MYLGLNFQAQIQANELESYKMNFIFYPDFIKPGDLFHSNLSPNSLDFL